MDMGLEAASVGGEPVERCGRALTAEEGPRERLSRLGAFALTDAELLAVLLGSGFRNHPVATLSADLIAAAGGLKRLVAREVHELAALPGLGPARACLLAAAVELGRRIQRNLEKRPKLFSPSEVYKHLAPQLCGLRREVFHVLCFNPRNILLHECRIATGTANACPVDPREVFAAAIAARASGIVVAHNHPSGDPTPSAEDIALTEQLRQGGKALGIRLLDHLVIADGSFTSMAQTQLMSLAADGALRWAVDGP